MNTAPTRLFICKIASRSKSSDGFAFVESGLPQAAEFGRHGWHVAVGPRNEPATAGARRARSGGLGKD
jgi:hypothetical protein